MNIIQVKDSIDKLINIQGTLAKSELLKDIIKQDSLDNELIKFLLNDFKVTYLSKSKINKDVTNKVDYENIFSFSDYLDFLNNFVDGTDHSIKTVNYYAMTSTEDSQFIKDIATKSIRLGIKAKTYNKVAKELGTELIPEFNIQLGTSIDNLKDNYVFKDMYVTEKLDGVRCIAVIKNRDVTLFARSGRVIEGLTNIESVLRANFNNITLDGELLYNDPMNLAEDTFRKTMEIIGSKGNKKDIIYNVFDVINDKKYKYRRSMLETLIPETDFTHKIPLLYHGDDIDKVFKIRDEMIEDGSEGVMINIGDAFYQKKRTKDLIKLKQVNDSDGLVKAIYEGEGKYKNKLGAIDITYKDSIVRIGSGFTDEERVKYWNNPELLVGKVGTYKFTTVSHNEKDDTINLRFARWVGIRYDKDEDDLSYDN